MARKLPMSPDISYMLGTYLCSGSHAKLCLDTESDKLVERFVKIAVMDLDTRTDAIEITKKEGNISVEINNSKLKKLLDKALGSRDKIFKYKNEYSAGYFAALFDCNGAIDNRGLFIKRLSAYDKVLLERIGFHTTGSAGKCYIRNSTDFIRFINPFSIKAQEHRLTR